METREYRTIDKTGWGPGPWQDEPDKRQWQDAATGLPCLLKRVDESGHLCGYVGVPEGHPAYGKGYGDGPVDDLDVHGGVTYAQGCDGRPEAEGICHVPGEGESDHVWWIGFDCAHYADLQPGTDALLRRVDGRHSLRAYRNIYRDVAYVSAECARLAAQLAEMRA